MMKKQKNCYCEDLALDEKDDLADTKISLNGSLEFSQEFGVIGSFSMLENIEFT